MTQKRLLAQQQKLITAGYQVQKNGDCWQIWIKGPEQSPFQGGQFAISFKLQSFPFKAPVVTFKTKIFHPNVDQKGAVCPDMLQIGQKWAPVKNLVSVMHKIISLLRAPNLDSPMNVEAAEAYKQGTWEKRAKKQTQTFAKPH